MQQIQGIDPNIIFNCSRINALSNDITSRFNDAIKVIELYHPNNRTVTTEDYINDGLQKLLN